MKRYIFFILILKLNFSFGQIKLNKKYIDSLLSTNSKEFVINQLYNYKLPDTINIGDVWIMQSYYEEYFVLDHFLPDSLFLSDRIKAIYYIYLLFSNENSCMDNWAKLIDTNTGKMLYDYRLGTIIKSRWLEKDTKIIKQKRKWISDLEQRLSDWILLLNEYGLDYLIANNISPIGTMFSFDIQELRYPVE